MIDTNLADDGLAALSVATTILLSEAHDIAVLRLPARGKARAARMAQIKSIGEDVSVLASAMQVLERRRTAR